MKLTPILLAGSLAVNATLVVAFLANLSDEPSDSSRVSPAPAATATTAPHSPTGAVDPELWNKLPASDWQALAANLRAKGFPPAIVRAIVTAQISESFRDRSKALSNAINNTPFWKNPLSDPQMLAAQRALSREQQKILKDVFGTDTNPDDPMAAVYAERDFSGVPAGKRDQVRQLIQEFGDQRNNVYDRARGAGGPTTLLPDDQARLRQLDNLQHAELAKILTPDELEAYDLRHSNTASSLKNQLVAFDPTEDEFKALYKLQASFDAQWGLMYATPTQEESRARSAAQTELKKQFEAVLGAARYADYQRASNYDYQQTTTLMARLELPPETANALYALQQEFDQRRIATQQTPLPADQRTAQLNALQQEALARVTPLLGGRATAVEAYQQNGGSWLQNLAPRPTQVRAAISSPGGIR